jgi:hypothetical protein
MKGNRLMNKLQKGKKGNPKKNRGDDIPPRGRAMERIRQERIQRGLENPVPQRKRVKK